MNDLCNDLWEKVGYVGVISKYSKSRRQCFGGPTLPKRTLLSRGPSARFWKVTANSSHWPKTLISLRSQQGEFAGNWPYSPNSPEDVRKTRNESRCELEAAGGSSLKASRGPAGACARTSTRDADVNAFPRKEPVWTSCSHSTH